MLQENEHRFWWQRNSHQIQILTSLFIRLEEIGQVPKSSSPSHLVHYAVVNVTTLTSRGTRPTALTIPVAGCSKCGCLCSLFPSLFTLAAIYTPAPHLNCVFLNVFLKQNSGLVDFACIPIPSYWFRPNIPAGWDLLFHLCLKYKTKFEESQSRKRNRAIIPRTKPNNTFTPGSPSCLSRAVPLCSQQLASLPWSCLVHLTSYGKHFPLCCLVCVAAISVPFLTLGHDYLLISSLYILLSPVSCY